MECNCNNNNNGGVIPWVRGNRLPLCICIYQMNVDQGIVSTMSYNAMTRTPYVIQADDTVTVTMKSGFRSVEMPFTTDGNKVLVIDNGELPTGTYTVEVTIERGSGERGRWQESRQVRIYENTDEAILGEMYSIEADLFFWAKGDTGVGIANITSNPDDTLTITMTDGTTYTTQAMKGDKGDKGDQGEKGTSIVSFDVTGQTETSVIYTVTFSDDTTEEVAVPKGPQGDTGLTGNGISSTTLNSDYTLTIAYTDGTTYTTSSIRGAQGVQGVSIIAFTQTGETSTNTLYNVVFSDGRTQSVAIPKGLKGDKGDTGNVGPQGSQGPKGDTVIIGDEQEYTLYNVTGQNTDGAMTQKAVTDNLVASAISYDNSRSLLDSVNVQGALDKVVEDIQEETPYNVDDYPTQKAGLGESTWFWNKNTQRGKHKVIPVTAGEVFHVTSQAVGTDLGAYSGWLTSSYTPPTTGGGDIPYVTGTTRFVTKDSVITAPEGAAWLCLTVLDGAGYTIINTVAKVTKLKEIVNETQEKFGDLSGDDIAKDLERTTGKYIDLQGEEQDLQGYFITAPIYISAGTKLNVTYKGGLISVVSKVDDDAYIPVLTDENNTAPTALTKHIVIEEDGFYVFCSTSLFGINAVIDLTVSEKIGILERDTIGENIKYTYKGTGQYIDSSLNIVNQSFQSPIYVITNEIEVKKGETITVKTKGGQIYIIVEYSEGEIVRGLLFSDSTVSIKYNEYSYTADKDMLVLVGGVNDSTTPLTITVGHDLKKLTQYHCGIYLYPFRAIVNKPVSIYRESVISGLRPLYNYTVQTNFTQHDPTDDYSKYTIRFKATSEGTTPLTVIATDEFNNQISKTVNVVSRAMPESKLSNVNSMDVMFLGDSMIGWNGNLVGGEWKRMLATNDSETYVDPVTKAVQLPTYNVCPNKLNLVGEQLGSVSGVRYCYVNRIQQILTDKRNTAYNPNMGDGMNANRNPFYNMNSSEPDTIGEDGFNRRVDFNWYFDNACGVGGYPKLFYIALGANDIYQTWNWSFDGVKPTTELLLKVIKKIKSVCDERAGGDSGIKIKVFNHQTYPLYNMYGYEFPILQQRLVWNALYDSYYEAITNPDYGVSEYTEFVDCGSKFDWRVGYTTVDISTNVRYDGNQDVYMEQTCHMNNVGAYNYADCLIDDFLVDSDFD